MGTTTKAKKVRYEPVLKLPPLSYEDFTALRDNIAVNGVVVPIVVDSQGPVRRIIDGNYRKQLADEFGYPCPEIVQEGLTEEEKRTLARALNLARRHLNQELRRQLIADQLAETPERSNRWIGKELGVHHSTVASVRSEMESTGQISQLDKTVGEDGKYRPAFKQAQVVTRPEPERNARLAATTLIHGDCRKELKSIATGTVDVIITDPIYPEVNRAYGRISEAHWHDMMREVVKETRCFSPSTACDTALPLAGSARISNGRPSGRERLPRTASRSSPPRDGSVVICFGFRTDMAGGTKTWRRRCTRTSIPARLDTSPSCQSPARNGGWGCGPTMHGRRKFLHNTWVGIQFWMVVGMVKTCRDIADLAFKDKDKK